MNPLHKLDKELDQVFDMVNKIIDPIKNIEFRKAMDNIAFEILVVRARLRKSDGWDLPE